MTELLDSFTPEERARFQEGLSHFQMEQQKLRELDERRSSSSRDTTIRYDRFDLRDER
jgi:hypothetical protein